MSDFKTTPHWYGERTPAFERVSESFSTEVLIIGGGITGLTAAYLALQAGKKVSLVERKQIARGDTGHTTAHLTGLTDARLSDLAKSFGEAGASLAWFAGLYAIEQIAEIVEREGIECEFCRTDGYWCQSLTDDDAKVDAIKKEIDLAQKLGFDVDFIDRAPIVGKAGMVLPRQAMFHPYQYLTALAQIIRKRGGRIFEHSEVTAIHEEPLSVEVNGHQIAFNNVMIATHMPLQGNASLASATILQTKLIAYTSYALGGRASSKGNAPLMVWDTSDPYNYLRIDPFPDHDRIIFGGGDHKTGQVTDTRLIYGQLEATLRNYVADFTLEDRWSGQVVETTDGAPFIGENGKGQFIATGFAGNGITFGTLAAIMFRDHLLGESNPWKDLFSIDRTILRSDLWEYVRSNLDYPYYMAADRLKWRGAKSQDSLAKGEGKVISVGIDKIACARDRRGRTHRVSAVCPHMGCIVHWNNSEETWDCPCHGSRFLPDGQLLAGPAESGLADKSQVMTSVGAD